MTRFEHLPKEAREDLKTDISRTQGNELLLAEVANTMLREESPIWSSGSLEQELDDDWNRRTVGDKLEKLEAAGYCDSQPHGSGRIYWWVHDETEWPMPPDAEIDPSDELTVREALEPHYAKVLVVALIGPAFASLPVLLGVLSLGGRLSTIPGQDFLSYGLILILLCYMSLVYAVLIGLLDRVTPEDLDLGTLSD